MPLEEPIASTFAFALSKLGQFASDRFAERLAPLGLRPRHCRVLELARTDSPVQLDIASAMGVSPSVVVTMLDELEDIGAVRRVRETADRRRQRVELTQRGQTLLRKARLLANQLDDELLASLSPAQRATLRDELHGLATKLELPGG